MRIRFVTRDQLQVLQASRMEKHTIPDGTIPLYGLSPSAVSKQWGKSSGGVVTWPISFTNASYIVTALKSNDHGGGIPNLLTVAANSITIELEWMSYAEGTGIQSTYPTNNINVIGIGH